MLSSGTNSRFSVSQRRSAIHPVFLIALLFVSFSCEPASTQELPVRLQARRAFGYLEDICRIGPRISGTEGMARQQKLIIDHFRKFNCELREQAFDVAHPQTGRPVRMRNLVVSWNPTVKGRVLLCCHYDTRPFPDRDSFKPRGTFVGANDGGSGVALFMEMAHHMQAIPSKVGVDFVIFDGEELVFSKSDKYFLGSEYFAKWYRDNPPNYRYVCGVLVDMIADKKQGFYYERNSLKYASEVTRSVWATARRLRVREFVARAKYEVRDDHLPLNEIARIPTCDIIDFDYPYWHTTRDTPRACSGTSIVRVGRVLMNWLTEVPGVSAR